MDRSWWWFVPSRPIRARGLLREAAVLVVDWSDSAKEIALMTVSLQLYCPAIAPVSVMLLSSQLLVPETITEYSEILCKCLVSEVNVARTGPSRLAPFR